MHLHAGFAGKGFVFDGYNKRYGGLFVLFFNSLSATESVSLNRCKFVQ